MGKRIPYGYQITHGRAEPDPEEAPKLQRLYELYLEGRSAAAAGTLAGIGRTGACCRQLLQRPVYLGTDYYPQLIPTELWKAVEAAIARRGAPFAGKMGKPVTEPNPILTQFAMDRGSVRSDDPAGYAALLYERIRPRKKKQVTDAPADVSGAFSYQTDFKEEK